VRSDSSVLRKILSSLASKKTDHSLGYERFTAGKEKVEKAEEKVKDALGCDKEKKVEEEKEKKA